MQAADAGSCCTEQAKTGLGSADMTAAGRWTAVNGSDCAQQHNSIQLRL
jgi:hypothetical protein